MLSKTFPYPFLLPFQRKPLRFHVGDDHFSVFHSEITAADLVETTGLDEKKEQPPPSQRLAIVRRRIALNGFESRCGKIKHHPKGWCFILVETTGLEPVTSCV